MVHEIIDDGRGCDVQHDHRDACHPPQIRMIKFIGYSKPFEIICRNHINKEQYHQYDHRIGKYETFQAVE
jgi:hypothetical protein